MQDLLSRAVRAYRWATSAVVLGTVATLIGCGSADRMAPVQGIVRLDGQPLSTGTVYFTPEKGGRSAAGKISSDGTFELSTFSEGDGASVGVNRVSVIAFVGGSGGNSLDDTAERRSLIPLHYTSPEGSNITFDVKSGEINRPEIELKSK